MKHHSVVLPSFTNVLLFVAILSVSTQTHADSLLNANQRIYIQYAPTLNKTERQQAYQWLKQVADALRTVYGEWPKDKFNITVKHGSRSDSPVPWGQVTRGNPDKVLLVINPESTIQEITHDWTAFHELSHLLIPYRGYGDMWFSEGLATYYQNIIQARAGLMSETDLWNKLAAGFERGRQQNQWSDKNLQEVSDNMRQYRNFMRVHWSGVHYWLTADIELRKQSQNKITLDYVLKLLKNCCQHQSMSVTEIVEQLDQLAGITIFKPLFLEYRASHAMPDYRPALTGLGVMIHQQNYKTDVSLKANAPDSHIRTNIYNGSGD